MVTSIKRKDGITFNETWLEDYPNAFVFDSDDNDQILDGSKNVVNSNAEGLNGDTKCKGQQTVCHDDGHWSEDEAEMPAGVTDAMLSSPDFVTDNERQHILNVAPGEGNRPVRMFRDTYTQRN